MEASTNQPVDKKMSVYNLPLRILCRVINVILKADPDTDEVFAEVTLLPEANQDENAVKKEPPPPSPPKFHVRSFCKTLIPSDASTHGGLVILKRHGDEYLPPFDMSRQPTTQELVTKDLHGNEWRFCHTFRGHRKRHLLQGGWSVFVTCKQLVAGDAFIFLRGENGALKVDVRRLMKHQGNVPPPVISSHSMHVGVLATAWHVISIRTMFTIYYKSRISLTEFIVPLGQFMESMKITYSIGMKFKMRFEGEETPYQRFNDTVVGIEDADPNMWQESKWKCLKVKWDETSSIPRPERVSPWQIEPTVAPPPLNPLPIPMPKRPRASMVPSSSDSSVRPTEGFGASSNPSNEFCAPLLDQTIAITNPTRRHLLHQDGKFTLLANQCSLMPSSLSLKLTESNVNLPANHERVKGQMQSNTECSVLSEYPSLCSGRVNIFNANRLMTHTSSSHFVNPDHSRDPAKKPALVQGHENGKSMDGRYKLFGISLISSPMTLEPTGPIRNIWNKPMFHTHTSSHQKCPIESDHKSEQFTGSQMVDNVKHDKHFVSTNQHT